MDRADDRFLFRFRVVVDINDWHGARTSVTHDDVGCVLETPAGGLLLQDMRAIMIVIYAPGTWHQVKTTEAVAVRPEDDGRPPRSAEFDLWRPQTAATGDVDPAVSP